MAPGYGYNMNMTGNPLMMLAQQGLGMLGGSSMGYGVGNFGGLTGMGMGCGNIFTNCYGEPNYDAMLGYEMFNIASTAAIHIIADGRASRVNNRAELKGIDSQINDKQTEINKLKNEQSDLQKELDDANSESSSLNDACIAADREYNDAKAAYEAANKTGAKKADGTEYTSAEIAALKQAMDQAKEKKDKADQAQANNDKIIKNHPDKIQELTTKIETAQGELRKLTEQRESQYNELSEKDKAKYCQTRFVTSERNISEAKDKTAAEKEHYNDSLRLVRLYESSDKAKKEIPEIMYNAAKEYIKSHPDFETK